MTTLRRGTAGAAVYELSNGRYRVAVNGAGAGYSTCSGRALTAWGGDWTQSDEGFFVYVRDRDRQRTWSATEAPVGASPEDTELCTDGGIVEFVRCTEGIETRLGISVVRDADVEVRRVRVHNRSETARVLELTSYLEIALNDPAAHAAHPAFSKLFVQTEYVAGHGWLLARRRPRAAGEAEPWLGHGIVGAESVGHETDRARFVGRGRSRARPRAVHTRLSGTVGSVLDPVFSLRCLLRLAAGESGEVVFLLAAGADRAAVLETLQRYRSPDAAAQAVAEARRGPAVNVPFPPSARFVTPRPAVFAPRTEMREDETSPPRGEALAFDNGYGGFAQGGKEYVVRLDPGDERPPMPWVNVVSNDAGFGFLVSESGAACTWSRNSREYRITPWSNDPVSDPYGEALYVRDEDAGFFWSPVPGPVPTNIPFEARHGFGYSTWRHACAGLQQETVVFVPRDDRVKITRLRLHNTTDRTRRLSVYAYSRLVLGTVPTTSVVTEFDGRGRALLARNPNNSDFADAVVFAAAVPPDGSAPLHYTADRVRFLGAPGTPERPEALCHAASLGGESGAGLDPCAALQITVSLPPGATAECSFLLGETADGATRHGLLAKYRRPGAVELALDDVRSFWERTLSAVAVRTPSPPIDLMMNGWLGYQNLSCRMWGRSAFYQSGGAFGFRDQLQDAAALVYTLPHLTRAQIVLHAAHQFVEGDVLHWWHPPFERGMRTRFADDLLWLPYVAAHYVRTTGDDGLLDEPVPFVEARQLAAGEEEAYLAVKPAAESAGIFEHCCRAIDRSLARGAHGLPLMGTGDWNDGMNRVGRGGRGESVWLGFFLYALLAEFVPLCERRGDAVRASRYAEHRRALGAALNSAGWDGDWYRRAYYDDGTPLGCADDTECRIDAVAQAWAVLSGAAPPERARRAMQAVETHLVSEAAGLVRLLTPPFDRTERDPGYIKGYVPGIRENGGQYTHAALWVVRAFAELGRRDRAVPLLEMLTPVRHAATAADVATYQVEPYVVAADIYGVAPHLGRGGWTWYTGSAGWMYRVVLESILGIAVEGGDTLRVRPCIPDEWPGFTLRYRLPEDAGRYDIEVRNPDGCSARVVSAELDGHSCQVADGAAVVPLARDRERHRVCVVLGRGR